MDRRINKTHTVLLQAMIALMGKRDWGEINVKQICDQANVARSTFYTHFNNKQELMDFGFLKLEKELGKHKSDRMLDENQKFSYLPELLNHIKNHKPIFCGEDGCAINGKSSELVFSKFRDLVFKFTTQEIANSSFTNKLKSEDVSFLAGGIYGVLNEWWLANNMLSTQSILEKVDKLVGRQLHLPG